VIILGGISDNIGDSVAATIFQSEETIPLIEARKVSGLTFLEGEKVFE